MILTYTKIINLPAMELKNQSRLGEVCDVAFNKTNFKISGFLVKTSGFSILNKLMVISATDIVELSGEALLAKDKDALIEMNEAIRIKESVGKGYSGIRQSVYTKSGKRLGKVTDFFVESDSLIATKMVVNGMMSERLIPTNHIIEFKKNRIIIKDDFELASASPALASNLI